MKMKTIETAGHATEEISKRVQEALERLSHCQGRVINGFGVFSDPSCRRADLLSAKRAIDAALEVANDTKWPKQTDYEHAE